MEFRVRFENTGNQDGFLIDEYLLTNRIGVAKVAGSQFARQDDRCGIVQRGRGGSVLEFEREDPEEGRVDELAIDFIELFATGFKELFVLACRQYPGNFFRRGIFLTKDTCKDRR